MQRMTDVLSRMLNDPATRAALSGGGEDSLEGVMDQQGDNSPQNNDSGSTDANEERSSTDANEERNSTVDERDQFLNNSSSNAIEIDNPAAEDPEIHQMAIDETGDEAALVRENSPTNEILENAPEVPMEIESSHSEERNSPLSSANQVLFENETDQSEQRPSEIESSNTENNNMMENLQDRLTSMRDGFLER